jgi:Ca2+-binding EF-hand superfamily protein
MRRQRRYCLLLSLLVVVAKAQEKNGESEQMPDFIEQDALTSEQVRSLHSVIDGDKDGQISMNEIIEYSQSIRKVIAKRDVLTIIDGVDADKDGKVSLEELLKDMEQWSEDDEEAARIAEQRELETAKFHLADADKNGALHPEELAALFYPETHDGILELTAASTLKAKDTNGDGQLTPKEFWEGDGVDGADLPVSDEEQADFSKLDVDGSGALSVQELMAWESGHFHTEEAMKKLLELTDQNGDLAMSLEELDSARELIAGSDAQYHLLEWIEHREL